MIYDKSGVAMHRLQSQGSLRRIATDWVHLQSSTPNNRDVPTGRLKSDMMLPYCRHETYYGGKSIDIACGC